MSFSTPLLSSLNHIPLSISNTNASLGERIASEITDSGLVNTLLDCLTYSTSPAIHDPSLSHPPLRHATLRDFVSSFRLPSSSDRHMLSKNDRVMVVLPTGPCNALALIALATYHTCAPVNASCTAAELLEDTRRLRAKAILTVPEMEERLNLRHLRDTLDVEVIYLLERPETHEAGLFDMRTIDGVMAAPSHESENSARLHSLADKSLVLHTSGTSGNKKIVPYSLRSLIVGTCAVIKSWDIREDDINMNMMPLFHVGGIVRNLLAPIISGGSVIVCAGFDADTFWSVHGAIGATWYYAAPTMHHAILAARPDSSSSLVGRNGKRIRMVCNAAGGLLPSLALELKETFEGAVILPSYGMTECMPIASPPPAYALDRPGTSGIACGPHLSIRSPGGLSHELKRGEVGAICVRGLPAFEGYEVPPTSGAGAPEQAGRIDTSAISPEGWFDSGDMGWMDEDGYLYITGRSKEIINKGGEVISPFEVEEAIMVASQGRVKATLAFSVPHTVLQETIGVVIVSQPGQFRISLPSLLALLANTLHPSKWPALVVYMDALPVNAAGKPLRIGLTTRLDLKEIDDSLDMRARHYEARELDTSQLEPGMEKHKAPIPCHLVQVDANLSLAAIRAMAGVDDAAVRFHPSDGSLEAFVSSTDARKLNTNEVDAKTVKAVLAAQMHDYCVPEHVHLLNTPFPRKGSDGSIDFDAMLATIALSASSAMSVWDRAVRRIIANLLVMDEGQVGMDSDFFLLGGNSLLLGRLAYLIKKETGVALQISSLFTNSTVGAIAAMVEEEMGRMTIVDSPTAGPSRLGSTVTLNDLEASAAMEGKIPGHQSGAEPTTPTAYAELQPRRGQTHPLCLIVQAIPFIFFHPLRAALSWSVLLFVLASMAKLASKNFEDRMGSLLCAIAAGQLASQLLSPLAAIAFKWLVIGRYRVGTYQFWSGYHLRWWIVNQALRSAGRGVFKYHPSLQVLYYRMLGAKIGKGVVFDHGVQLGEYDLLEIQDGCRIDRAVVRGFCVEREGMFRLGRIVLGKNVVINTYTQIPPGSVLKQDTVWGPHASSFDQPSSKDLTYVNRTMFSGLKLPWKVFIAWPIIFVVTFVSYLPWFAALYLMTSTATVKLPRNNHIENVIWWFSDKERIAWHIVARIFRSLFAPLIRLILGIIIKRLLGLNDSCTTAESTQFIHLRRYISNSLLSQDTLKAVFEVLGTHYEATSCVFRAMGAKIGRRVYWPGSGIYCPDPELLEVGDDVVFGSRSELFTTDALGSGKITVGAGAMIADRCVLLPGVTVGRNTVMGSGCLTKRGATYADNSTWIGNHGGDAICLNAGSKEKEGMESTLTPFGKAFYQRQASFFVIPYSVLVLINILVVCATASFWSFSTVCAAIVLRQLPKYSHDDHRILESRWFLFGTLYGLVAGILILTLAIQNFIVLAWVIATKWFVIGQRKPGPHHWNKSSYCQRWQLHLVLSSIMQRGNGIGGVLSSITGSAYIVWYYRALGLKAGRDVSIFAGGKVGLMTEPDLVQLGDRVALDDCSVVAHINSRGQFALNALNIENGSAMRTGSRLLSGASMEQNSMLMEHTLLLSGDIAEENTVYVGWPAKTMEAHKKMMERDEDDEKQRYDIIDCQRCHVAHGSHDIMTARCGHAFCQPCTSSLMSQKPTRCPVCQAGLVGSSNTPASSKRGWRRMFFIRRRKHAASNAES